MKTRDQKLLEEVYKKIQESGSDFDNVFESEVNLEVIYDGQPDSNFNYQDVEAPNKVGVKYSIYIDYRSYGIKSIDVHFVEAVPFSFDIVGYNKETDNETRKTVSIDLSILPEVKTELNIGAHEGVYPTALQIRINRELKLHSATLVF